MVTGDLSPETDRSETLQHCSGRSEVSGRFGTSTEVSKRHIGPKYQTVQPHGLNCPTIWTEVSHPMVRSVCMCLTMFAFSALTLLVGDRKDIRPVKNWVVGFWCGCLERGAELRVAQLMPLPLTVSCFSKIQTDFYCAMLCIRGTSHGPVSVYLSQVGVLLQEAPLSPRVRTMRCINWNLASCHATVQKLLIRQVPTKSMVWSWRFSWRQCVIDYVHSTMTRSSRLRLSQVS